MRIRKEPQSFSIRSNPPCKILVTPSSVCYVCMRASNFWRKKRGGTRRKAPPTATPLVEVTDLIKRSLGKLLCLWEQLLCCTSCYRRRSCSACRCRSAWVGWSGSRSRAEPEEIVSLRCGQFFLRIVHSNDNHTGFLDSPVQDHGFPTRHDARRSRGERVRLRSEEDVRACESKGPDSNKPTR